MNFAIVQVFKYSFVVLKLPCNVNIFFKLPIKHINIGSSAAIFFNIIGFLMKLSHLPLILYVFFSFQLYADELKVVQIYTDNELLDSY